MHWGEMNLFRSFWLTSTVSRNGWFGPPPPPPQPPPPPPFHPSAFFCYILSYYLFPNPCLGFFHSFLCSSLTKAFSPRAAGCNSTVHLPWVPGPSIWEGRERLQIQPQVERGWDGREGKVVYHWINIITLFNSWAQPFWSVRKLSFIRIDHIDSPRLTCILYTSVFPFAHFSHFTLIYNNHIVTHYHLAWEFEKPFYHLFHYTLLHSGKY